MRRLVLLSVLALTACGGDPNWVNPNLPRSQASTDYGQCRREAETYAGGSYNSPPTDDRNTDARQMSSREDDQRRFNMVMNACMRGLGYFPK